MMGRRKADPATEALREAVARRNAVASQRDALRKGRVKAEGALSDANRDLADAKARLEQERTATVEARAQAFVGGEEALPARPVLSGVRAQIATAEDAKADAEAILAHLDQQLEEVESKFFYVHLDVEKAIAEAVRPHLRDAIERFYKARAEENRSRAILQLLSNRRLVAGRDESKDLGEILMSPGPIDRTANGHVTDYDITPLAQALLRMASDADAQLPD